MPLEDNIPTYNKVFIINHNSDNNIKWMHTHYMTAVNFGEGQLWDSVTINNK